MADVAGYSGRILTLWWKEQSEPISVISGYAEYERQGLGPVSLLAMPAEIFNCKRPADKSTLGRQFCFYPRLALEYAFRNRTPAGAGLHATQVLEILYYDRLSAAEALRKHKEGIRMGHTVVVMASVPISGRFWH